MLTETVELEGVEYTLLPLSDADRRTLHTAVKLKKKYEGVPRNFMWLKATYIAKCLHGPGGGPCPGPNWVNSFPATVINELFQMILPKEGDNDCN